MEINFEELFDKEILRRGYRYYLEDAVQKVTKNEEIYKALVYGTEIYEVEVNINENGVVEDMDCDCPYARNDNCKHMAALLYYIKNEDEIENIKETKNVNNYDKVISKIKESEIKEFILQKLYSDVDFQNEFRTYFVQYFEKAPKEFYKKRICESVCQAIGRKGFIEYRETNRFLEPMDGYIQEARNLIKHKEYQAPFWIVSIILEELPGLPIDDSDGITGEVAYDCAEVVEEILKVCKDKNIVNEIFNWINEAIKKDTLKYYLDGIEELLDEYFTEDMFKEERLKTVELRIEELKGRKDWSSEYDLEEFIRTKIELLYQLGRKEEALEIIKENVYYVSIRRMLMEQEKVNGNIEKVEELLLEGIQIALKKEHPGMVMEFVEDLLALYQEQNQKEKYKNLIEETLFKYDRGSFEYYKKLKNVCSKEEWNRRKDKIIKEFEKDRNRLYGDDLRQIYIEEEYYDKLYKSVMRNPSFERIVEYESFLKKDFAEGLLEIYRKIVEEKAQYTGRSNYEEIREILEHMRTLKGGEQLVEKMVEEYKIKYANRRAMLEELNKIEKRKKCMKED